MKESLDPPVNVYDKTRKYYDMHWTAGQFVDDYFVRMGREARHAKDTTRQACINMISQLPDKIAASAKAWIEGKSEEISDEDNRVFMVKVRTLLTEGGFPIDYGWRRGTSGNVHKIEDKYGCKETTFNDTESTFRRDEVL